MAKVPVRVYNNSTITGLASKASDEVRGNGWTVAETGNYSSGTIPTTTVYFRPGTDEEASAKELAAVLRARVEPRFDGIQSAAAGIILIVTNDFQGPAKNK
ncbi:LytR C-terminal domain-containing protein [Lentzea sp. NPDC034063]|uniref:LytR C-terminal domain-containing protein n=1 Tax=unclassified Lentzea TaxID=2643253 RepID=UPI0033F458E8